MSQIYLTKMQKQTLPSRQNDEFTNHERVVYQRKLRKTRLEVIQEFPNGDVKL